MNTLKRHQLWIALAALLLPILARALFFYQGFSIRPKVQAPAYTANLLPQPPVSTAASQEVQSTAGKIVVVDYNHDNQFEQSEIEELASALTKRGARLEFDSSSNPSLSERLKYASAYVVFSP